MYYPRICATNVAKLCKKVFIKDIKRDLREMPGINPIKSIEYQYGHLKGIIKNTCNVYLDQVKTNEIIRVKKIEIYFYLFM